MACEEAREAAERLYPLPHGRSRGDGTPEGAMQVAYETGHAAGVADGRRQAHEIIVAVLQGQGIALDTELDNWTFHAPFWAIERALDQGEPRCRSCVA